MMTWAYQLLWEYLKYAGPVLLITLVFYGLERRAPAERGQPARCWLFNVAYSLALGAAVLFLNLLLFNRLYSGVYGLAGGGLLPDFGGGAGGAAGEALFALAYFVVWDLCQYLLHRLQHSVPVLWETHKFHHSDTALNASSVSRVHTSGYVVAALFHLPVILLFGGRVPHFVAAFLLLRLWGFFNHANIRVGLGPLTPLLSGPQWHRIHHSVRPEHYDKNFASFFPFIDILFGTYYRPRAGEYPPTGLVGEAESPLSEATVGPLLAWRRMISSRIGRFRGEASGEAG